MHIAFNLVLHERMKYFHVVRNLINQGFQKGLSLFTRAAASTLEGKRKLFFTEWRFSTVILYALVCQMKKSSIPFMHIAFNSILYEWMKYFNIDCHAVCNLINQDFVSLVHVSSQYQFADLFIKALFTPTFSALLFKMGFLLPTGPLAAS